jgi:hypothetical protein
VSGWLWRVEARTGGYLFGWSRIVDRLSRKVAGETAEFYAGRYPEWQLRLHDEETGELIHLGKDGKPLVAGVIL